MGKLFKRDSEKPAERKPADIQGKVNTNPKTGAILSGEQKQRIVKQKLKEKNESAVEVQKKVQRLSRGQEAFEVLYEGKKSETISLEEALPLK